MKNLLINRKNILIIAVVFLVVATAVYLLIEKRIFADTNKTTRNKPVSQLSKYLKSGVNFVPGEAIVKYKTPVTKEMVELNSKKNISVKEVKQIDSKTFKVKFSDVEADSFSKNLSKAPSLTNIERISVNKANFLANYSERSFTEQDVLIRTMRDIETFRRLQNVDNVQPNYIYQAFALPNDTYINPSGDGETWSSGAFSQQYPDSWGLKTIKADKAWPISTGNNVIVAVIDTGIDYLHEDIKQNVLTTQNDPTATTRGGQASSESSGHTIGYNAIDGSTNVMDENGHGTHVSGIIAAQMNNALGIAGVAPNAKIMPVKVLDEGGYGTDESIARGIIWAADRGAKIMNMSLGGFGKSKTISDAIGYASAKGSLVIVAAGNSSDDTIYYSPAGDKNVVAVAATSELNTPTFFSNFGSNVSISAPGGGSLAVGESSSWLGMIQNNPNIDNILSLKSSASSFENLNVGGNYVRLAGTSMAAPYVTGAAAVILGKNPNYSADQLKSVLIRSAKDVIDPMGDGSQLIGWDESTGYGILDVQKALETSPNEMPRAELFGNDYEILSNPQIPDQYLLSGTAAGSNFKGYSVSIADYEFNNWSYLRNGYTVLSESSTPITNGVVASIPKEKLAITGKAFSRIKLTVEGKDGTKSFDEKLIYRGTQEISGFPIMTDYSYSKPVPVNVSASRKIIAISGEGIYAINTDGTRVSGWSSWDDKAAILDISTVSNANGVDDVVVFYSKRINDRSAYAMRTFKADQGPLSPNAKNIELTEVTNGLFPSLVKAGSGNLIATPVSKGQSIHELLIHDMNGNQKSSTSGKFFSIGLGKNRSDKNEKIYLVGNAGVNGLAKQGVYILDPFATRPSLKPLLTLSDRDSNNYYLNDLSLADVDADGKIEIGLGQYGLTKDKVMIIDDNKTKLFEKSYNGDTYLWGPPGAIAYNFADINNDKKPEFGYYDVNSSMIRYVSSSGTRVASIRSKMSTGWIVANTDQTPTPEIITTEWATVGGISPILKVYNSAGQKIKQFSNFGSPGYRAQVFNYQGINRLLADSRNPDFNYLHQIGFQSTDSKLEWPSVYHDSRRTYCYGSAN